MKRDFNKWLETIGNIYGETPQIYETTKEEANEDKLATNTAIATEKRSPFSFFKCGIKESEKIVYVNDDSTVCTVAGDREIYYNDKKTSLTALAKKLLNKSVGIQGTLYFKYNGEILSALRKRLEDEGKYCEKLTEQCHTVSQPQQSSALENDDVLLYFTMKKYPSACKWSKDGYLLLKGSKVSQILSASCKDSIRDLHNEYSNCIDVNGILMTDIMFKSSSSAAMFVSGSSLNGKVYWKDSTGILLKDLLKERN